MIMSLHDPLVRKRSIPSKPSDGGVMSNKKIKTSENFEMAPTPTEDNVFSEKMYSAYVKGALDSLDKNDSLQINTLTAKVGLPHSHNDAISLLHFNIVLNGCIANISKLDNKSCHNLTSAILAYDWLAIAVKSDDSYGRFIELYSHFLSVLVSSLPKYLSAVTNKLVSEFPLIDTKDELIQHHKILLKIMRYIPTCINTFPQTLQRNFPHHLSTSSLELSNYVNNLMKIIEYCPDLQFSIWQLIIECCIKLDVELQNELDDLDDDEIEELINGDDEDEENDEGEDEIANKTDENVIADLDEDEGDEDYLINPMTSTVNIKRLLTKLDSIINLLLTNTAGSFSEHELIHGNGVSLFNTITSLFRSHILPTHFTKLIQFTLFHISQYHTDLSESFLVLLIDVAFNTNEILEKRLKAMQYLSSYVARAKNLTRHQIVFVVTYLTGWLDKYIEERECEVLDIGSARNNSSNKQVGGMERFKLFYAAFQALLYIFCFRHKSLYKEDSNIQSLDEAEWDCNLDKFFQKVILAKFNPLKFCDETVVAIFAKIATKLNVCYPYSIIEHNKRERMLQTNGKIAMPSAVGNFKQKQEFLDLEAYFPFDPLVLPTSKQIVSKNYVEWAEVNPSTEDDEDEDSASHLDEDGDEITSDEEITSEEEDDD